MAELLDDESFLYSPDSARPLEILPEMLDKPSPSNMLERESLHTWLGHLCISSDFGTSDPWNPTAAKPMKDNGIPVRGVKHTDLSNPHLIENADTKPNEVASSASKKVVNKPLSKVMLALVLCLSPYYHKADDTIVML